MHYPSVLKVVVKYKKESRVPGNGAIGENLLYIKQSIPKALARQKKTLKKYPNFKSIRKSNLGPMR
jgi:hypothetical protein